MNTNVAVGEVAPIDMQRLTEERSGPWVLLDDQVVVGDRADEHWGLITETVDDEDLAEALMDARLGHVTAGVGDHVFAAGHALGEDAVIITNTLANVALDDVVAQLREAGFDKVFTVAGGAYEATRVARLRKANGMGGVVKRLIRRASAEDLVDGLRRATGLEWAPDGMSPDLIKSTTSHEVTVTAEGALADEVARYLTEGTVHLQVITEIADDDDEGKTFAVARTYVLVYHGRRELSQRVEVGSAMTADEVTAAVTGYEPLNDVDVRPALAEVLKREGVEVTADQLTVTRRCTW